MNKRKKGKKMATQMAATPTLYGRDAQRLLKSLENKPTEKSRQNALKLREYFKSFEGKGK
ncbi:hypothetical protein ACYCSU_16410 [Paenibacillus sp. ALE1]